MKQTSLPGVAVLGRGYASDDFAELEDLDDDTKEIEGIIIYKIDGPLYFANAQKLKDSTRRIDFWGSMHAHPSEETVPMRLQSVVFDMSELKSVDSSALAILLEIVQYYTEKQRRVAMVRLRKQVRIAFQRAGIVDEIGENNVFTSLERAVEVIQQENLINLKEIEGEKEETLQLNTSEAFLLNSSPLPASSSTSSVASGTSTPRSKKSAFFAPPIISSPLLRSISKIKLYS